MTSPKVAKHCFDFLNSIKDTRDMVKKCIAGIDISELKKLGKVSGFYATRDTGKMIIEPIPNIFVAFELIICSCNSLSSILSTCFTIILFIGLVKIYPILFS